MEYSPKVNILECPDLQGTWRTIIVTNNLFHPHMPDNAEISVWSVRFILKVNTNLSWYKNPIPIIPDSSCVHSSLMIDI